MATQAPLLAKDTSYSRLLGKPTPDWSAQDWINSEPLTLEGLRGHPILIRWWTGPECPHCSASAPILSRLQKKYAKQGLAVLGFYHHKSDGSVKLSQVRRWAKRIGMDFPIAVDPEWQTLRRYWLDHVPDGSWTSVSFLIDRGGIVRYIHPGGTITEEDGVRLAREIEKVLEE